MTRKCVCSKPYFCYLFNLYFEINKKKCKASLNILLELYVISKYFCLQFKSIIIRVTII